MAEKSKETDHKRRRSIYYVSEREGKKALLIFDGGDDLGNIHVYELRESIPVCKVEEECKKILGLPESAHQSPEMIVPSWIEHKYGFPSMTFDITP